MKHFVLFACVAVGLIFAGCRNRQEPPVPVVVQEAEPKDTAVLEFPHPKEKQLTAADISLTKELLYDQHTLEDTYPYKDTVRSFKWDVIRNCLAYIENMQRDTTARWVVLQNYKNLNKEAPLVRKFVRNVYRRVSDTLGVERYQSVPLYLPADTLVPERYGRDGTIAYLKGEEGSFYRILPATFEEEWLAPRSYLKQLPDSTVFNHESCHYRNACSTLCSGNPTGNVSASTEENAYGVPERRFGGDRRLCPLCQSFYERSLYSRSAGECTAYKYD